MLDDALQAKEWLKYRYGVFDEHGYYNDMDYPLAYCEVHDTDPTDVLFKPLACTGNPSRDGHYR